MKATTINWKDAKEHWEDIYHAKKPQELSWYQEKPKTSLNLIAEIGLNRKSKIIDIGAGDSTLVDNLIALGYRDLTLLDVSEAALEKAKNRLGNNSGRVKWVVSDVREFKTDERYDIWHDRAVLHFLTAEEEVRRYADAVRRFLNPNGYVIIAAFSVNGPKRCSGLEVRRYSENSLKEVFCDFEHIKSFEEEHQTPWGTKQAFVYNLFRKR